MRIMRINFQKFIKECAIVDNRLPHFFGAGFATLASRRERARGSVILNNHWMIDRQIGRAEVKILQRVATRGHHLGNQLVGLADGSTGIVDEPRLDATPFAGKCAGLFVRERVQFETADARCALSQNRVRTFCADSLDRSFVLGSELFAQADSLPPTGERPDRNHKQHHNNTNPDDHEGL